MSDAPGLQPQIAIETRSPACNHRPPETRATRRGQADRTSRPIGLSLLAVRRAVMRAPSCGRENDDSAGLQTPGDRQPEAANIRMHADICKICYPVKRLWRRTVRGYIALGSKP